MIPAITFQVTEPMWSLKWCTIHSMYVMYITLLWLNLWWTGNSSAQV